MESIIARQQVGKRKKSSELSRRPTLITDAASSYKRILDVEPLARPKTQARPQAKTQQSPRLRLTAVWLARLRKVLETPARFLKKGPKRRLPALGLALVLALAALAGIFHIMYDAILPLTLGRNILPEESSSQDILLTYTAPELASSASIDDASAANLPPAPVTMQMETYTAASGDSLASIAKRFGLNTDTIVSANNLGDARAVRPGKTLRIPNLNGVIYKVHRGDTLASVAKRYKVDTTKLVDANDLASETLSSGQNLFIPGARLPKASISQALGFHVGWPVRGPLTSFFGYRPDPFTGVKSFHAGIDIAVDLGTEVRAAAAGKVDDVGYNGSYGNYVILNHGNGMQTLYGHLTSASVSIGQSVEQGSIIALSGNTGYSTGPHVHFGVYKRGIAMNPLKFLK